MLSIVNVDGDPLGECTYNLSINTTIITTFKHDRREGLAQCLRDAADAVDEKKEKRVMIVERIVARTSDYKKYTNKKI